MPKQSLPNHSYIHTFIPQLIPNSCHKPFPYQPIPFFSLSVHRSDLHTVSNNVLQLQFSSNSTVDASLQFYSNHCIIFIFSSMLCSSFNLGSSILSYSSISYCTFQFSFCFRHFTISLTASVSAFSSYLLFHFRFTSGALFIHVQVHFSLILTLLPVHLQLHLRFTFSFNSILASSSFVVSATHFTVHVLYSRVDFYLHFCSLTASSIQFG